MKIKVMRYIISILFTLTFFISCSLDIDGPKATAKNAFNLAEDSGATVDGELIVIRNTMVFKPTDSLIGGKVYRITLSSELTDLNGNKMISDYYSNFKTGTNLTPFSVMFISPTNQEFGVDITNSIVVQFGRPMDTKSVRENVSLSPQIDGQFIWNAQTNQLTFIPFSHFTEASHYTFTLNQEVKDFQGVALGDSHVLHFTTGTNFIQPLVLGIFQSGDIVPFPDINNRYWSNISFNALRDDSLVIDFNQPMDDLSTKNAVSITPQIDGYYTWQTENVLGTNHYQLVLHPYNNLDLGVNYEVNIADSAKGMNGVNIYKSLRRVFSVSTNYFIAITNVIDISNVSWAMDGSQSVFTNNTNTYSVSLYFSTFDGVGLNKTDVMNDKISIERVSGDGPVSASGVIAGYNWITDDILSLDLGNLSISNVYHLTVSGGVGGIKDKNDNWMKNDLKVKFYVTNN